MVPNREISRLGEFESLPLHMGRVDMWLPVTDKVLNSSDRTVYEKTVDLDFLPVKGMTWCMGDWEFNIQAVYFNDGIATVGLDAAITNFSWEGFGMNKIPERHHAVDPQYTQEFLEFLKTDGWHE